MSIFNTQKTRKSSESWKTFEYLFDGSLGTWNTAPMDLGLTDDAKPVCLRTYPVPRVHEAMFRKESERLFKLGVIEEANESEWGAPSFAQTREKTNQIRFLSDFQNLNRQLKCKPYFMKKYKKFY